MGRRQQRSQRDVTARRRRWLAGCGAAGPTGMRANKTDVAQLAVSISTQSGVGDVVVEVAADGLAQVLGAAVVRGPDLDLPAVAYDRARGQYRAEDVVAAIPRVPSAHRHLGIVAVDLYTAGLNFVFGMAVGEAAVVSIHRLGTDADLRAPGSSFRHRVAVEAIHEIAHTLGLRHCPDPSCAMHFSNTLADTDRKGPGLCRRCRGLLSVLLGEMEGRQ